jgi:glycosyltransferase involved in cell wall biosynthesis
MKLSLITINLNNASGLVSTLESVKKQIFTDFEHILIDGGSKDQSLITIKEYQKTQSGYPVIWSSEPDRGIYNAMNKGIRQASGEYCFFLNSGDYLVSPSILETVFSYSIWEDVVYGNLRVFVEGKLQGIIRGKKQLSFMDLYRSNVVKHQSSFIKRNLFERCGLYRENLQIVADFEFFMRTIGMSDASYRFIDHDIAYFENSGISNRAGSLVKQERDSVLAEYLKPLQLADYRDFEKLTPVRSVYRYGSLRILLKILLKISRMLDRVWKQA